MTSTLAEGNAAEAAARVPDAHRAYDLTALMVLDVATFMAWFAKAKAPIATERLMEYWAHGEGAAKINWGVPGDFNRCRLNLGKYVPEPEKLNGLCANLHHRALGVWPGHEDGKK